MQEATIWKRHAYFRAGLMTALQVTLSVSFCVPHPVAVSAFMICSSLCACTEMLWMCVLYVSFGSRIRPRTFGCVAMGYVSVIWLRWCWGRVGGRFGPGSRRVGLCYVCVCCGSGCSVLIAGLCICMYCARRIPAHLRCTQCSIMLHHIDICFLTCICLWQISQIQTCLRMIVGPELVWTSAAFMRSIVSHPVDPHARLAQKR